MSVVPWLSLRHEGSSAGQDSKFQRMLGRTHHLSLRNQGLLISTEERKCQAHESCQSEQTEKVVKLFSGFRVRSFIDGSPQNRCKHVYIHAVCRRPRVCDNVRTRVTQETTDRVSHFPPFSGFYLSQCECDTHRDQGQLDLTCVDS